MQKFTREWTSYGMYFHTPPSSQFSSQLKATVPQLSRKWDPVKKAWWISDEWIDEVHKLCKEMFEDAR